jgi:hypothetical protein
LQKQFSLAAEVQDTLIMVECHHRPVRHRLNTESDRQHNMPPSIDIIATVNHHRFREMADEMAIEVDHRHHHQLLPRNVAVADRDQKLQ